MWFYGTKIGHRIAAYEVAGQRPQRFLYETWRDLALFAEMRLLTERSFINSI
jgi:hypothetical protein